MVYKFELFHLSLLPRSQQNLFDNYPSKNINREEWLRIAFGEEQSFTNLGSNFHYVPTIQNSNNFAIIGKIGRKVLRDENKPPSEGFDDITHETWKAAMIVLDPSHHDDGQKIAIQKVKEVGDPAQLLAKLIGNINERYLGPYSIQAAQIIEEQSFWDFVKQNEGNVTSVTLDFIPPNMFGSEDEFTAEMKEFRDNEAAKKVRIAIENDEGIKPDTERMRRAVKYASKGGGKIRAKAKNNKTYNSHDKVKRSSIEEIKETGAELVEAARKFANRILGRE